MYEHLKHFGQWQRNYAAWMNAVFRLGGRELLDVGTAYGAHVKAFREIGIYAWGCDKCLEMIRNTPFREIYPYLFVWDIIRPLGNFPKLYDVVVSHGVLEHIKVDDLLNANLNMLSVLQSGGLYVHIITVQESPAWAKDGDPTHVTIKPIAWWRNYFEQFDLVDLTKFYEGAIREAEKEIQPFREENGWGVFIYEKK